MDINDMLIIGYCEGRDLLIQELVRKNQQTIDNSSNSDEIIEFIVFEVDNVLFGVDDKLISLIDIFKEKCIDVLLDSSFSIKKTFVMSHDRDLGKINELRKGNLELFSTNKDLILKSETLKLRIIEIEKEIETLNTVIFNQKTTLKTGYNSWLELANKVNILEQERSNVVEYLEQIKLRVSQSNRELSGNTIYEQIKSLIKFTSDILNQETNWQNSIRKGQNFDKVALEYLTEIELLNEKLSIAQNRITTFESININVLKEIIIKQIKEYFNFILSGIYDLEKKQLLEKELLRTYSISRYHNFSFNNLIIETVNTLYKEKNISDDSGIHYEISSFFSGLLYGMTKNEILKAVGRYRDIQNS